MPKDASRSRRRRKRSVSRSVSSDDSRQRKRRVEKLSKKVEKHLKKHHVATEGYNQEGNRFQDPNLSQRFIWSKKIERQLEGGASVKDLDARAERERQHQRLEEIEKVRKSREEREAERARQQDELSMIERARLASEAASALEKEEAFLLQQAVASCKVRLENSRMRPIDVLVRALLPEFCWNQSEPAYSILQKMNMDEITALCTEITEFKVLDCHDPKHVEYWKCIEALCQRELNLAAKQESVEPKDKSEGADRSAFIRERQFYVEDDVKEMLAGKSLSELTQLENEVGDLLRTSDNIDPDYWTRVLEDLKIEKLRTKIRSIQKEVQKASMQHQQSSSPRLKAEEEEIGMEKEEPTADSSEEETEVEMEDCQSPEPLVSWEGMEVVHEDEDYDRTALLRRQVKQKSAAAFKNQLKDIEATWEGSDGWKFDSASREFKTPSVFRDAHTNDVTADFVETAEESAAFDRLKSVAVRSMGSDEGYLPFGGEVELECHVYWWHEKYRPKKPKYFNRVHTGYEWNKYNQTHYDHDNPPPKVVQGYKFNIFYPDLIDDKTPPHYEIQDDPESKDIATCWLRFKSGPPYEDLAFRIVNKDWEYSHKKGFKCVFERGILHLYFNFKRQRYRR